MVHFPADRLAAMQTSSGGCGDVLVYGNLERFPWSIDLLASAKDIHAFSRTPVLPESRWGNGVESSNGRNCVGHFAGSDIVLFCTKGLY